MILYLLVFLMFLTEMAHGATRIASPSGSGSTCSLASPCSATTGLAQTGAGDTLQLRGGTYNGSVTWDNASGGSWSTPIIIEAFPNETVIHQASSSHAWLIRNVRFAIIRGLIIDGTTGTNQLLANGYTTQPVTGSQGLIDIACVDGNCSSDLIFEGNILRNTAYSAGAQNNVATARVTWRGNEIYNIGKVSNCPTLYIGAPDSIIENNYFHDMACPAVNYYNETGITAHNAIVRNNRVDRAGIFWAPTAQNGTLEGGGPRIAQGTINTRSPALYISSGNNQLVYNNAITSSPGGIQVDHNVSSCLIFHNTIFGNNSAQSDQGFDSNYNAGIGLSPTASGCVVQNNLVYQPTVSNPPAISNNGSNNTTTSNMCSTGLAGVCSITGNPSFVDQNNGDFRLQSTSPARDSGVNLAGFVSADILGTTRPQGAAFDIGAFEFVEENPPEPQGNVAWWKFDENTGTSAADSSGQGHTLTAQGNATWVAPGAIGPSATRLDGVGDYWSTILTAVMKPPSTFAITGWIRPDCGPGEIFSAGDSYGAETTDTGNLFCYYYDGANFPGISTTDVNLCDGAWHHFGCEKTSTAMLAYVDGLLRGSTLLTGAISYTLGSNALVGRSFTGPGVFDYQGDIDHLRVYDGEIGQQGYLNDFNEAIPGAGFVVTHCVYTQANASLGSPRGGVDGDISNSIGTPIGIRCSVQYTGNPPTPSLEYFPWSCSLNGGAFTPVSNSFGSLGIKIHTDSGVDMGQTIPAANNLLPLDGFTPMDGTVTADMIDTTNFKVSMTTGKIAEFEGRFLVGSPGQVGDTYQCRPHRADGSVMAYAPNAIRALTVVADPSLTVISGGALHGGRRQ